MLEWTLSVVKYAHLYGVCCTAQFLEAKQVFVITSVQDVSEAVSEENYRHYSCLTAIFQDNQGQLVPECSGLYCR